MLAAYTPGEVVKILKEASKAGADAAKPIVKAAAPIGDSMRQGQYYRRMGLQHGTLRKSVRAAAIRQRGGVKTVGHVVAPMGSKGFTRGWVALGTPQSRGNPWVERIATWAFSVASRASEAILRAYVGDH